MILNMLYLCQFSICTQASKSLVTIVMLHLRVINNNNDDAFNIAPNTNEASERFTEDKSLKLHLMVMHHLLEFLNVDISFAQIQLLFRPANKFARNIFYANIMSLEASIGIIISTFFD